MSTLKVDGIRSNSASSDAITLASDGTCTANVTSVNDGQLGNRRININGGFQVFQRSTSATSVGSSEGYFAPDRYRQAGTGSMRYTASQSTDVPAGYGFSYSLKYDCTTASGTVSAGHFVAIEHRILASAISTTYTMSLVCSPSPSDLRGKSFLALWHQAAIAVQ